MINILSIKKKFLNFLIFNFLIKIIFFYVSIKFNLYYIFLKLIKYFNENDLKFNLNYKKLNLEIFIIN
jgi:hypothetical protein